MLELHNNPRLVGIVLFVASLQFVLAMAVEELLLPGYNPISQVISDLGNDALYGSHASIFNVSVFLIGILTLSAAYLLASAVPRVGAWKPGLFFLALAGLGASCVGIFPENVNELAHGLSASVAFLGAGLAMILFSRSAAALAGKDVVRPLMILGGLIDLASFVAFAVGAGGSSYHGLVERMIVAPVLAWAIFYGAFLLLGRLPSEAQRARADPLAAP